MNYKIIEKNDEIFFKYLPKKNFQKNTLKKKKKKIHLVFLKNLNLN